MSCDSLLVTVLTYEVIQRSTHVVLLNCVCE